jgi:hypothetical protein
VIGLGLRQRPGDPRTLELGRTAIDAPDLHRRDGFVAGLHRSCRQAGLSDEDDIGNGEVSSHEACDLGASDTEGNLRRSGTRGATDGPPTASCSTAANSLCSTQIDPSAQ